MAANDIAPGYLKLFYVSNGNAHTQTLPVIYTVPDPVIGSEPSLSFKGGGSASVTATLSTYLDIIDGLFNTGSSFTGWEAYKKSPGEDPTFVFGSDLDVPGTSGTSTNPLTQAVFSYRTGNGGILKLYFMEHVNSVNVRQALRTSSAGVLGSLTTFLLGSSSFVIGRDGGYPISGLFYTTKVNDAIRKRELLNA